ncbi:hypothetical protein TWF970_002031 [Orbilia oligospora]|uniref:Uncharacterized protein n=1 Tax=Orbilia oligospora TaxID=2813651 RepID=A0A7C8RCM2_ORBOL|nr:hypothetical protein TWF970_002031 [Orbilia oligospora]
MEWLLKDDGPWPNTNNQETSPPIAVDAATFGVWISKSEKVYGDELLVTET